MKNMYLNKQIQKNEENVSTANNFKSENVVRTLCPKESSPLILQKQTCKRDITLVVQTENENQAS